MQNSLSKQIDRAIILTSSRIDVGKRSDNKYDEECLGLKNSCMLSDCSSSYNSRVKNSRKNIRELFESSSTQTWEPWIRTTCVSKSRLQKSNNPRVSFCCKYSKQRDAEYHPSYNDGYNQLSEFNNRFKNRGNKILTDVKTSTIKICKRDGGYGVCDTMKDRIFDDISLQTGTSCCSKTIYEDRPLIEDLKLKTKDSKATASKSRLSRPGPSSSSSSDKPSKLIKARKNNGAKKSTVKKRSVQKMGAKKNTSSSSRTTKLAVETSEFSTQNSMSAIRKRDPKKLRNLVKIKNKKATRPKTLPAKIVKHVNVKTNGMNDDENVFSEKIKNEKSVNLEVQPECSTRCQGVVQLQECIDFDGSKSSPKILQHRENSNSSSFEIIKPSTIVRRQTAYHVNELSLLKSVMQSGKRSSTTSESYSESDNFQSDEEEKQGKESNSSISRSAAAAAAAGGIEKNSLEKIVLNTKIDKRDSVSSHESGGKFNTPIYKYDDKSGSPALLNIEKLMNASRKKKSPMMIWQFMQRKRYGNTTTTTTTTTSSSMVSNNNYRRSSASSKDPFLSLFISCSNSKKKIHT